MNSKFKFSAVWAVVLCMSITLIGNDIDSYFPTKEGLKWEFQIVITTSRQNIPQIMYATSFASRTLNGTTVVPVRGDIMGQSQFVFIGQNDEGIYEYAVQTPADIEPIIRPKPRFYIKNPVKVGVKWVVDTESVFLSTKYSLKLDAVIESIDAVVTVPAGTFENCVKVKMIGTGVIKRSMFGKKKITVQQYDWYAPGVGSVKSIRKESSNDLMLGGGSMSLMLKSYKL